MPALMRQGGGRESHGQAGEHALLRQYGHAQADFLDQPAGARRGRISLRLISASMRVRSVRGARARRSSSLPERARISISVSRCGGGTEAQIDPPRRRGQQRQPIAGGVAFDGERARIGRRARSSCFRQRRRDRDRPHDLAAELARSTASRSETPRHRRRSRRSSERTMMVRR